MTIPPRGKHRIYDPDETTTLPSIVLNQEPAGEAATNQAPTNQAPTNQEPADEEPAQTLTVVSAAPLTPPAPEAVPAVFDVPARSEDDSPTAVFSAVPIELRIVPPSPASAVGAAPVPPPGETPTTIFPVVPAGPSPSTTTSRNSLPGTSHTSVPNSSAPTEQMSLTRPATPDRPSARSGPPGTAENAQKAPAKTPTAAAAVPPLEAQHTTVLPAVRDRAPAAETEHEKRPPRRRWNERLVPLRAKRTEAGYQSVYSELTRTTAGTIVRGTIRGTGELLITFGLVALLFAAYEIWGNTAVVESHQGDLTRQLEQQWAQTEPTVGASALPNRSTTAPQVPAPTKGIAMLYIPRLGKKWVVVHGVAPKDIRYAPGHYPNTAMPGQRGNFSVAGHRNRATFWDLDRMQPNDKIIVETAAAWFVYRVTATRIVLPSQVEVVSPVPPGQNAGRLLTLTTCNPKLDNYQRLIVHAEMLRQQPKSAGRPSELGG